MIIAPKWLYFAYGFNILILIPVVWSMFFGPGVDNVFEAKVAESAGLRIMVGSLWLAILAASFAGFMWPSFFAPVVLVQIVYKFTWLAVFVLPLVRAKEPFPVGISAVFAIIVVTYPVLFWLATRADHSLSATAS